MARSNIQLSHGRTVRLQLALEELHDGVEALVRLPALHEQGGLSLVGRVQDVHVRSTQQLFRQAQTMFRQASKVSDAFPGFSLEDVVWEDLSDDAKSTSRVRSQSLVEQ